MSDQATLFDSYEITKVEGISKLPTDQAFHAFHKANPWVVKELEKKIDELTKGKK